MQIGYVRPTASCDFYKCPVCGKESTIIGETFYCTHCGCEIDNIFDNDKEDNN